MYQPAVLAPEPDPYYVRALKALDPALRLVFGYERYLLKRWVVERKIPPERYFSIYASLLESSDSRFVQQPIYDNDKPIYDEWGNEIGCEVVGYRQFDLAPEWEHIMTVQSPEGDFKPFGEDDLTLLRRMYAFQFNHPYSKERWEQRQREEAEQKEISAKGRRMDAAREGLDEAWHAVGKRKRFGMTGVVD